MRPHVHIVSHNNPPLAPEYEFVIDDYAPAKINPAAVPESVPELKKEADFARDYFFHKAVLIIALTRPDV